MWLKPKCDNMQSILLSGGAQFSSRAGITKIHCHSGNKFKSSLGKSLWGQPGPFVSSEKVHVLRNISRCYFRGGFFKANNSVSAYSSHLKSACIALHIPPLDRNEWSFETFISCIVTKNSDNDNENSYSRIPFSSDPNKDGFFDSFLLHISWQNLFF